MELVQQVTTIARAARSASRLLSLLPTTAQNQVSRNVADALRSNRDFIKKENEKDVNEAVRLGFSAAGIDRLRLTDTVIDSMVEGLGEIVQLPDPVGEVERMWKRPNGLLVGRMRIPLGVIAIIYESRPNVTVDAGALCIKSGNAVILRGGREAIHSNRALTAIMQQVVRKNGIPEGAIQLVPMLEREAIYELLKLEDYIDLVIPRGGEELIRAVAARSRIPVIKHYKGVCHIFVDERADPEMAESIIVNAKVQRPAVCNALETLLIHEGIAPGFLPRIVRRLQLEGVEIRACPRSRKLVNGLKEAVEDDWYQEYLDLILSVKVVSSLEEAIDHIHTYGSMHTEAIITSDYQNAQLFLQKVHSSVVLVNASTRFNDGYQLGLGAEIGISTTRLHAFGPMGLHELTTCKYVVFGNGQVRQG